MHVIINHEGKTWEGDVPEKVTVPPVEPPQLVQIAGRYDHRVPFSSPDMVNVNQTPIPWDIFRDNGMIAKPLNGVKPDHWRRLSVYGAPNAYGEPTQAVVDGVQFESYPYPGGSIEFNMLPQLKKTKIRGGPRNFAMVTPYWMLRGHSRKRDDGTINRHAPQWIAIDLIGRIYYFFDDGRIEISGQVPVTTAAYDFSYDSIDRTVFWTADTLAGHIIWGKRSGTTFEFRRHTTSPLRRINSVREWGGKLYAADELAGGVWEISRDTGAIVRQVCALPQAFFVDFKTTGEMVVMDILGLLYPVNVSTGVVGATLNPMYAAGASPQNSWAQFDIDRTGSCGPVDTIFACRTHGQSNGHSTNAEQWMVYPDGSIGHVQKLQWGRCAVGIAGTAHGGTLEGAHYWWNTAPHPDEALSANQGIAQIRPIIYAAIAKNDASWPAQEPYDHNRMDRGRAVIMNSTPSFAAFLNWTGGSLIAPVTDMVGRMSYQEAAEFVAKGMIGSTPRPEIRGEKMKDVLYWFYRQSMEYVRVGAPLIAGLDAWWKAEGAARWG